MAKKVFIKENAKDLFRAILKDIYATEISDGYVEIFGEYLLINHKTQEIMYFTDSFVDDGRDLHAKEFFKFLAKSRIKFYDYSELIGMCFEAEIHTDGRGNKLLVPQKICSKPPKI